MNFMSVHTHTCGCDDDVDELESLSSELFQKLNSNSKNSLKFFLFWEKWKLFLFTKQF